jgi:hypothetical protein
VYEQVLFPSHQFQTADYRDDPVPAPANGQSSQPTELQKNHVIQPLEDSIVSPRLPTLSLPPRTPSLGNSRKLDVWPLFAECQTILASLVDKQLDQLASVYVSNCNKYVFPNIDMVSIIDPPLRPILKTICRMTGPIIADSFQIADHHMEFKC